MSNTKTPIMGTSVATAEQMASYLLSKNPNPKLNIDTTAFCRLYLYLGALCGVRGDLEFARSCKETGNFAFTGTVVPEQNNYCGHGTVSATEKGSYFPDEATGILAQIQHAKAYASTEPLNFACVDGRFNYVKRGSAPNMEDMGGKWAVPGYNTAKYSSLEEANNAKDSYGYQVVRILNDILGVSEENKVEQEVVPMTKKIALDAGHGLKTAGKQTPDGIKEWTLNDKVRDKVVEMLKDYDVEFVFPDNNEGNVDESLTKRRTMYLNEKVDAAVSIHHNALKGVWCTATGVEVYVDRNATTSDRALAEAIYKRLPGYTGLKGRGIKEANWTVINQNAIPAILTEGGFMDCKKDYAIITSDAGQTAYAKAIAEGLIEFLGLKKKTTSTVTKPATSYETFQVKFLEDMNVRTGAGTTNPIVATCKKNYKYTIVETAKIGTALWGRLKSGAGWVCIAAKYCKRV